jgi:hypothetical protein
MPRSKNEWSYTSTTHYAFMAWYSVKAQGQIYLYLKPFTLPLTLRDQVSQPYKTSLKNDTEWIAEAYLPRVRDCKVFMHDEFVGNDVVMIMAISSESCPGRWDGEYQNNLV